MDGFSVGYVPNGVGGLVSDYSTEWEGVAFESRVWEHRTSEGGYRVDLKLNVLRGERLTSVEALRAFITEYEEQDPDEWDLRPFQNGQWPGYRTEGLAFWLVDSGVGVSVRLDPRRFEDHELTLTARGVRPEGRTHH
ncbi:hypothetical protein F4561_000880 [Lipingzhangella halophila]|uniref:Uncharacterized protein n=1 Tax=Lipingzhangella halophila TaxID=1783352 RepID=A0A7W7W1V8_9ACTN|nr:hypothetical protein [Lipingzhangella halophila]MBB4930060.1 hypothetical protein [Lipingzhangella halophila]